MRVLATDVVLAPGLVDLPTVLRSSDVVTLHAPLTDDTRNLIGAEQLAMMRRNAILINTARAVSPMKVRWRRRFKTASSAAPDSTFSPMSRPRLATCSWIWICRTSL